MADLSSVFYELAHDEKLRPYVARLVEHKFPQRAASFADVKQKDEIQKLRNEIAQDKQIAKANEMTRSLNKQRDDLVTSGRYTKEQADEIKKVIDRHGGTLDYNQAAVLYAHENPSADPTSAPPEYPTGRTWEFPTVHGRDGKPIPFKDFITDPTTAAQNAAYSLITDFKKRSGIRA
jgi:hypothetical protein